MYVKGNRVIRLARTDAPGTQDTGGERNEEQILLPEAAEDVPEQVAGAKPMENAQPHSVGEESREPAPFDESWFEPVEYTGPENAWA